MRASCAVGFLNMPNVPFTKLANPLCSLRWLSAYRVDPRRPGYLRQGHAGLAAPAKARGRIQHPLHQIPKALTGVQFQDCVFIFSINEEPKNEGKQQANILLKTTSATVRIPRG
jgi:hypothetical protein